MKTGRIRGGQKLGGGCSGESSQLPKHSVFTRTPFGVGGSSTGQIQAVYLDPCHAPWRNSFLLCSWSWIPLIKARDQGLLYTFKTPEAQPRDPRN